MQCRSPQGSCPRRAVNAAHRASNRYKEEGKRIEVTMSAVEEFQTEHNGTYNWYDAYITKGGFQMHLQKFTMSIFTNQLK